MNAVASNKRLGKISIASCTGNLHMGWSPGVLVTFGFVALSNGWFSIKVFHQIIDGFSSELLPFRIRHSGAHVYNS